MKGKVFLVGAGPGDPELLTVRALRLLDAADAVLYDELVTPEILKLIPSRAQLHNVGKRCGNKRTQQDEINFLMIALADAGLQVVRLKSGDPMIFGRAGEEMEALRRAGIEHEVVPGVTSALGAAAVTQIPFTDRRVASSVVFLTGHRASGKEVSDWSKLAMSGSTLVIYMPGQNYSEIAARLEAAGWASEIPCAVISRATTPQQKTHGTTIAGLRDLPKLPPPSILVVGEVVDFAGTALEKSAQPIASEQDVSLATLFAEFVPRSTRDEESIA